MKKADRQKIFDKFGGKCAYSGKELQNDWQVDHVKPKHHYRMFVDFIDSNPIPDESINHIDNLLPALKIINHYKRGRDLESFRRFISKLHLRMKRYPKKSIVERRLKQKEYVFKVAEYFGITIDNPFNGKFYFETLNNQTIQQNGN